METIQEWFEKMEEPERSLAIANTHEDMLKKEVLKISHALCGAFLWDKTDQGEDYWKSIQKKYK